MKNLIPIMLCILALLPLGKAGEGFAQSIGINATGATPDASALLDLNSTNKGFLITRVDTANIPSPAFGLITLSPTDSCLYLFNGNNWIGIGGTNCSCNCGNSSSSTPIFTGCIATSITILVPVTSPTTGKIWMDRNLGASQVATSSTDSFAYGCLYQWGRFAEGHEDRGSAATGTNAITAVPNLSNVWDGKFITEAFSPWDWLTPQDSTLWQGANGINNPCPSGYRIPTEAELDAERLTFASTGGSNSIGAFGSPLKLTMAGDRSNSSSANLINIGIVGIYWTSTISGIRSKNLRFTNSGAFMNTAGRALGASVRCIKD